MSPCSFSSGWQMEFPCVSTTLNGNVSCENIYYLSQQLTLTLERTNHIVFSSYTEKCVFASYPFLNLYFIPLLTEKIKWKQEDANQSSKFFHVWSLQFSSSTWKKAHSYLYISLYIWKYILILMYVAFLNCQYINTFSKYICMYLHRM